MRGRKRKQSVKAEEEPKEETTDVQASQSTNSSEKIVPSFGKKKKVSNAKTRSAKSDTPEPNTQTTTADIHKEETRQLEELQQDIVSSQDFTKHGLISDSNASEISSIKEQATKGSEHASLETNHTATDPKASSCAKDTNEQEIENSQNESKEREGKEEELEIVPINAPEIQAGRSLEEGVAEKTSHSSQNFIPEVTNFGSLKFGPAGDAKPYERITKGAQNVTVISDDIDKPQSKEEYNESLQKSVVKDPTSSEMTDDSNRNAKENVDVAVLTNSASTKDVDVNEKAVATNTAQTNHNGTDEIAVKATTAPPKDNDTGANGVVTNISTTTDAADQSDTSQTLRDLSYEEESQESVVEVHKLLDYHFENFPKLAETKTPIFGFTNECMDAVNEATSQREILPANGSLNSPQAVPKSFSDGNDSTKAKKQDNAADFPDQAQCSKDQSPCQTASAQTNTPQCSKDQSPYAAASVQQYASDLSIPPTQGFGFHDFDFPITATQNFNISYSPLMSITPDSSNPGSPKPLPAVDAPAGPALAPNLDAKPVTEWQSNVNLKIQKQASDPSTESEIASIPIKEDSAKDLPMINKSDEARKPQEEPSVMVEDAKAYTEEQRPSKITQDSTETTKQMSCSVRPSTSKNDMLKKVDLIQSKEFSSMDNAFVEEVMNMEDDFGVSDSQMCAIDYEEPMPMADGYNQEYVPNGSVAPQGATSTQGQSSSHPSRPDQEGHNIVQDLIKDISGLNKMLLKTKREMEAFRRNRSFTPLQNRNWQQ